MSKSRSLQTAGVHNVKELFPEITKLIKFCAGTINLEIKYDENVSTKTQRVALWDFLPTVSKSRSKLFPLNRSKNQLFPSTTERLREISMKLVLKCTREDLRENNYAKYIKIKGKRYRSELWNFSPPPPTSIAFLLLRSFSHESLINKTLYCFVCDWDWKIVKRSLIAMKFSFDVSVC